MFIFYYRNMCFEGISFGCVCCGCAWAGVLVCMCTCRTEVFSRHFFSLQLNLLLLLFWDRVSSLNPKISVLVDWPVEPWGLTVSVPKGRPPVSVSLVMCVLDSELWSSYCTEHWALSHLSRPFRGAFWSQVWCAPENLSSWGLRGRRSSVCG